jgi:ribosomal protein S18 acetylase RimI-like enzyme
MRKAEELARARGCSQVLLGVDKSNRSARRLFKQLGYAQPKYRDVRGIPGTTGPYDILVSQLDRIVRERELVQI